MRTVSSKTSLSHGMSIAMASLAFAAIVGTSAQPVQAADSWPGFRGAKVDGISNARNVFPDDGEFELVVAWKKKIGSGYAGIAVEGANAVTAFSDGTSDVVALFDAQTGEERWRFELDATYLGHDGGHTGPIATPLLTDGGVFVLGPRGKLVALELLHGKRRWSVDLVKEHQAVAPHYGFTSSPLLHSGVLIIPLGAGNAAVAGFDPKTGKKIWTAGAGAVAYQSPVPWHALGKDVVVVATDKHLLGVVAATGEVTWEHEHGGTGAMGAQSLVPIPAGKNRLFLMNKRESSTVVELKNTDDGIKVEPLWEESSIRKSYNVPVYHDGHIYGMSARLLTCVDAVTGARAWRSREPGDGFTIIVDGCLVVLTKRGGIHVVAASPGDYQEHASLQVFDDLAWSVPSFANGSIFARSLGEIARIDIRRGQTTSATLTASSNRASAKSTFARFLTEVDAAADKKSVVDRFMNSGAKFPLVEADGTVHFVFRGEANDVAIAGEMIGARMEQNMTRLAGTDLFYYSQRMEPDARTCYAFIRDYEQMPDPLNPQVVKIHVYQDEMAMNFSGSEIEMSSLTMPGWMAPTFVEKPVGKNVGSAKPASMESKILETTVKLIVYLPAAYEGGERFPVAYIHDGGLARKRGKYINVLDNLIGKGIKPVITVFILHSAGQKPDEYAEMFTKELIPYIDQTYRTIATSEGRASIGGGMGGVTALNCAFLDPTLVGNVATQSAFLFDSSETKLRDMLEKVDPKPMNIYMDWGKYDLRSPMESWGIAAGNVNVFKLLKEKGFTPVGGEVNDGTGWPSWRNRTDVLLKTILPAG